MLTRHSRAGALAVLLLLAGASLAGAVPVHPADTPTDTVEAPAGPGLLATLWDGLLELAGVEAMPASTEPASPSGDGEISTLDGGDATTDSSDDDERTPGLDPNG